MVLKFGLGIGMDDLEVDSGGQGHQVKKSDFRLIESGYLTLPC